MIRKIIISILGLSGIILPIVFSDKLDAYVYSRRMYYTENFESLDWGGLTSKLFYDHAIGLGASSTFILLVLILFFIKEIPQIISMILAFRLNNVVTNDNDDK